MTATEDSIGMALRDRARDQLACINMQLARAGAWQHSGIHRARRAIARLRAILRLLAEDDPGAASAERELRRFAHDLSPLRDAQAAFAAAKQLARRSESKNESRSWREIAASLAARRERVLGAALAADPGFSARRDAIGALRPKIEMIGWGRVQPSGIVPGLARSARRARKARRVAAATTAESARHELRRRNRRLLRQIETLRAIAREPARPHSASVAHAVLEQAFQRPARRKWLKRIIELQGWEQDLRALQRALRDYESAAAFGRARPALRRHLRAAQAEVNAGLT